MKNIIIIDDDAAIQDSLSLVFDPALYNVTIYAGPGEIMNNRFTPPDIFIIDKQLSGIDGLEVCRHLKGAGNTDQVPVIIISASPSVATAAMKAGASMFIEKPYSIHALREAVIQLIS